MPNIQSLVEKIQSLPPERIAEVEDFVEFLTTKNRQRAAMDRFLAVAPALERAGAPPITEEEIQAEVDAIRRQRQDHLFTSPALLAELADVLTRPFAAKRLALLGRTGNELLADYAGFAEMVTPRRVPEVVIADPDDDQVIAAAVAAKADIIASGDHHLLSLGTHQRIRILHPADVLASITGAPER